MHKLVSFNQEIIKSEDASMSAVSVSGLYGKGVFSTLAILAGEPFLFDKHWDRLTENAGRLGIDLESLSKDKLISSLYELLSQNGVLNGRSRITVFDSSSSKIWRTLTDQKCSVLIQTADPRDTPKSLRLTVSPFVVSSTAPLNNIKSCNYLEQTVSYDAAIAAGFDEAVRLNEKGETVSGCMSNIFWTKDGEFFTPSLYTGCLAGTTRSYLIERCDVGMVKAGLEELFEADHVFLTSSGLGLAPVSEFIRGEDVIRFDPLDAEFIIQYKLQRLQRIHAGGE